MNEGFKKNIDLVLVSINTPLLCGVYQDFNLKFSLSSMQKTGDGLFEVFFKISTYLEDSNSKIKSIFYAKGPGSFSSLKLTHIFLQTLCLSLEDIEVYSVDSFYFNNNSPIKAFGNKYFIKTTSGDIQLKEFQDINLQAFSLPEKIDKSVFNTQNQPLYILPPI